MDARFINPVLHTIVHTLETMAQVTPEAQKPRLKQDKRAAGAVTGIIDMVGQQTTGSIAVSFTKPAAIGITHRILRHDTDEVDEQVQDMVGEITNIVAGGSKAKLLEFGYNFDLSLPSVVAGDPHEVNHKVDGPTILLPFDSELGNVYVEICFQP